MKTTTIQEFITAVIICSFTIFGGCSPADDTKPKDSVKSSKEQAVGWQKSYDTFVKALKKNESMERGATIEWEAKFDALVTEDERFIFDGIAGGGNASIQFRDQRPKGVKFDLPALDVDSKKLEVWFECTDADIEDWKKVAKGTKVRFSGKLSSFVQVSTRVNNDGSTELIPLQGAFWFKDVKIAK